jgi:hypothetical protein
MFLNQGTSLPVASQFVNGDMASEWGDMASEWEELVELDDVQLATVVGGLYGLAAVGAESSLKNITFRHAGSYELESQQ